MRNDPYYDGQTAYNEIKHTLVRAQRGLCAYCEMRIADELEDAAIDARKHEQRIEHFHPKDDRSGATHWALEWAALGSTTGAALLRRSLKSRLRKPGSLRLERLDKKSC